MQIIAPPATLLQSARSSDPVTPLVRVSSNSGAAEAPTGGFGFLTDAYRFGNGSSLDALRCVASTRNRDKIGGPTTALQITDLVLNIPEEEV